MASYRSVKSNYYSDKQGQYTSVGTILPIVIDQHTDDTNNLTGKPPLQYDVEYNYPGWVYTDGQKLKVWEYPHLYLAIGDNYKQSGEVNGGSVLLDSPTPAGSIQKMWWHDNKLYVEILNDPNHISSDKRVYPYGSGLAFIDRVTVPQTPENSLGSIPTGLFTVGTAYSLVQDDSGLTGLPNNTTVYKVLKNDGNDFDGTQYTQGNYTIDFNATGEEHPRVLITKTVALNDYPYLIGDFRVPDYRERKLIGYGNGVNGGGTPVAANITNVKVGAMAGQWYVPKSRLDDVGSFFTVSDVTTSGYENVSSFVPMRMIGSVKYTVGPMDDAILPRPPEHDHYLLHSRPDETAQTTAAGFTDTLTAHYRLQSGMVNVFLPETASGAPLGHSHGLIGQRMQNESTATFGNVIGIGEVVDDTATCKSYRVTQAPPLNVTVATSDGTTITVNTSNSHNLSVGNWITITGATGNWDGSYEVKTVTSSTSFTAEKPTGGTMPSSGNMASGGVIKQADGIFEAIPQQDDPYAFVVDDTTVIGLQDIITYTPGDTIDVYEEELETAGNINKSLADAGTGVVKIELEVTGAGGSGGSGTANGNDGGNATVSLTINGTLYTLTSTGGKGGKAGDASPPSGGLGGGWSVSPSTLANESGVSINVQQNGNPGGQGVSQSLTGGYGGGSTNDIYGAGGAGVGEEYNETGTTKWPLSTDAAPGGASLVQIGGEYYFQHSTAGGSPVQGTLPTPVGTTEARIWISGGKGGDGNGQGGGGYGDGNFAGHSGCPGRPSDFGGGVGTNGSLLYLQKNDDPGQLTFVLASAGGDGSALQEWATGETTNGLSGKGGANGGTTGAGALGNAGTGGAGGGATSLKDGLNQVVAGAGGGGAGGGGGGGQNSFSPPDVCDRGQDGQGPVAGLSGGYAVQGFTGNNGNASGCTAGSGGGGGGGFGNTGAGGGEPGQSAGGGTPGTGHGNAGGGKGGQTGQSGYKDIFWDVATLNINGSDAGGYIRAEFDATNQGIRDAGGGGGSGATLKIQIQSQGGQDLATAVVGSLGGKGTGGGEDGADGYLKVKLSKQNPAVPVNPVDSVAAGRGYKVPGFPTTRDYEANYVLTTPAGGTAVWADANPDGKIKIVTPAATGTFPELPASFHSDSTGATKCTRHIRYEGEGTRVLTVGPLNSNFINRIYFDIIKGNNSNGGETPDENLLLYWSEELGGSESLAGELVLTSVNESGWATYDYQIPPSDNEPMRKPSIYLNVKQARSPSNEVPENTAFNDNYGISQMILTFNEREIYQFVPSTNASLPGNEIVGSQTCGSDDGINMVRREVDATDSGMTVLGGDFVLNSSTPISITSGVIIEKPIPLITKYHRSKYLIKAH